MPIMQCAGKELEKLGFIKVQDWLVYSENKRAFRSNGDTLYTKDIAAASRYTMQEAGELLMLVPPSEIVLLLAEAEVVAAAMNDTTR